MKRGLKWKMRDSYGMSETGEIPQERSDEEAQRSPRGKRSNLKRNTGLFETDDPARLRILFFK
ncbi:hypothetical protein [Priestia koreensis]|uniref:hypothetical protein n=1 Tax=Priestia koreensis TaxID=284581 RepID=UPI0012EE260C|nr:hypothetical protein [Priestia koreensis]